MPFETLNFDVIDHVATIALNRPQRLNALTAPMLTELALALAKADADTAVRAIVLAGAGRAFCAGADLDAIKAGTRDLAELEQVVCRGIVRLAKPVIAAVHGPAVGAGAEIAIACDFLVMAQSATLTLPEARIGTYFGGGVTFLLPRLIGLARARDMLMLGRRVGAAEAHSFGLAGRVFEDATFAGDVSIFARDLAAAAPLSLQLVKRHLSVGAELAFEAALAAELDGMATLSVSGDCAEGLAALREKRRPTFKGC